MSNRATSRAFLDRLSRPAQRALTGAGIHEIEDLARFTPDQVECLHGIGPKAMRQLREVMSEAGVSFAEPKRRQT